MLFPMLTAEWLNQLLYFSTEYHTVIADIIILFCKYLVNIKCKSEAWLSLFWEFINEKLFAVYDFAYLT
jgi:hypothetical protein